MNSDISGVPPSGTPYLGEVFVTPHARREYANRVANLPLPDATCEAEIKAALRQGTLFRHELDEATLWGVVNGQGFAFLILTDPADEGAAFLVVRSVGPHWFWHEARAQWRKAGLSKSGKWKSEEKP